MTVVNGSFKARARTIDHLGREQIADCPTAVSELWKNAYDAYARGVELNVHDETPPVAAMLDDGHGMSRGEFEDRWLVVGTEAKFRPRSTPPCDHNGLRKRFPQGQKGIGRLSCANLGPIVLVVSKRVNHPFVAALIDWRLFENPFINLSDLTIPITEFETPSQLFNELPHMSDRILENLPGAAVSPRTEELRRAWREYDKSQSDLSSEHLSPSEQIARDLKALPFAERHLERWSPWGDEGSHGTAMLFTRLNYDLQALLASSSGDAIASHSKARFFETLSSFVDPYVYERGAFPAGHDPQFSCEVTLWRGGSPSPVVGTSKDFNGTRILDLEHRLEGRVDERGVFRGRVKAFGHWLSENCEITPVSDLPISSSRRGHLGPFDVFIAAMEFTAINSTHSTEEYQYFHDLAERYSGFMMFRDGLRVMPYGRPDNDFFEIEKRRSMHAGREFWNHRQMFGRLAISRMDNPNLIDKAGREGLLDNQAAKTLRALVTNILQVSARRYFGTDSDIRGEELPEIRGRNLAERAKKERNKARRRQRTQFRGKLSRLSKELPDFAQEVSSYLSGLDIHEESGIRSAQNELDRFRDRLDEFRLPGVPRNLGRLEETFSEYTSTLRIVRSDIQHIYEIIEKMNEEIEPSNPSVFLYKQLERHNSWVKRRLTGIRRQIIELQKAEHARITHAIKEREQLFRYEAEPIIKQFEAKLCSRKEASAKMDNIAQRLVEENRAMFLPYMGALESLQESIDLEFLATYGEEEENALRGEINRLNSLAQLGIAVEIVGHELQSYDSMIGAGLAQLPENIRSSAAARDIQFGYEGLTDQLRFLSPLRLAGPKIALWMTGKAIIEYIGEFFKIPLGVNKVRLEASEAFLAFRVHDQKARLLPVFINLINNSIYWVASKRKRDGAIRLDVVGEDIVVSDNGPGIERDDIGNLFSLFFTRKVHGGRGVGLYLCRANLTAGGHSIKYEPSSKNMPLPGANFLIRFRGARFNGE